MKELRRRLRHGAGWSLVGVFVSRAAAVLASIAVARLLGREMFGQFGMVQSTVAVLNTVIGGGLGLAATRHMASVRSADIRRAERLAALVLFSGAILGVVVTIALFLMSKLLADNVLASDRLTVPLQIASLTIFFGMVNGAQNGVLMGLEAFKATARANFFGGVLGVVCVVAGVLTYGLNGALAGLALSMAAQCIFTHRAMLLEFRKFDIIPNFREALFEWKVLYQYALPSVLASALAGPVNWAVTAILANRDRGYYELGAYNAANQWFNALTLLPTIVSQAMMPILSELISGRDRKGIKLILNTSFRFNALLIGGVLMLLALASPIIMGAYGPDFRNQWPVMLITVITAAVIAMQTPLAQMLAAADRMWLNFWLNGVWGAIFVVGATLLVQRGAMGLAIARAISYVGYTILLLLVSRKIHARLTQTKHIAAIRKA